MEEASVIFHLKNLKEIRTGQLLLRQNNQANPCEKNC